MMRILFSTEAHREFEEAEHYYNRQAPRIGDEFRVEIKAALPRIQSWPLSCPIERGDIRRLTLSRFPYKLLYSAFPLLHEKITGQPKKLGSVPNFYACGLA
ncbi:MAG: hypothetical protein WC001_11650 [Desulfurivibrionaceae bacterium]